MPQTDSTLILETLLIGSGRLHSHIRTSTRQRLDFNPQQYQLRTATAEEFQTTEGIQFSKLTLTLYKVSGGNMQIHTISEEEFYQ